MNVHRKVYENDEEFGSTILQQELQGVNNIITSQNNTDILKTIKVLNESYTWFTQKLDSYGQLEDLTKS